MCGIHNIHGTILAGQGFAALLSAWYACLVVNVTLRFYAELNDFIPERQRSQEWTLPLSGTPSVKDLIESCGVPHVEVDLILVDGESVGFDRKIVGGERIAVYPVFERFNTRPLQLLRPRPLRVSRFVVDANLGKLARMLRLLGFDSLYEAHVPDDRVVDLAAAGNRIILTRDRALLMRKRVTHGYWVRSNHPRAQLREVVDRLDLRGDCAPYTRCMLCNGSLVPADVTQVCDELPPRTRSWVTEVFRCDSCGKLYWRGSHWERLVEWVNHATGGAP